MVKDEETVGGMHHARHRGVRKWHWGRSVIEIRVLRKHLRIWLGSFPTLDMAVRAYEVVAFCLKGKKSLLNFPQLADIMPRLLSTMPTDIRVAAAAAAAMDLPEDDSGQMCHRSYASEPYSEEEAKSGDRGVIMGDLEEGKEICDELGELLWSKSDVLGGRCFSWPFCLDEFGADETWIAEDDITLWV